MNSFRVLRFLIVFCLQVFIPSGSRVSGKPPQAIQNEGEKKSQEFRILYSPTLSASMLDDVPIVNPTTPGTGTTTPTVSPPTTIAPPTTTTPTTTPTTPPTTTPNTNPASSGGSWCIASPSASPTALQVALDYACGYGGADCSPIQPGGSCYNPNTVQEHASYAFNDYYQKHPGSTSCVFGGTAQLTNTDPSTGNCHFTSSSSTSISPPLTMTPTVTMSPPITMSPPVTMSPPDTTIPGSPTIYGAAEPTGQPSSANSVSPALWLVVATIALIGSLNAANNM